MLDCIIDGIIDSIKIIPYLFAAFLVLEFLEHKLTKKTEKSLERANRFGPIVGGVLGALPQCGFGTIASNLFSSGVITMGTLIAVFLSTSDEMLPIMISEHVSIPIILCIIAFKVIVGIMAGFVIDMFCSKGRKNTHTEIYEHCHHDECHCENNGIIKSSMIHTLKITLFIFIINIGLNLLIHFIGEEQLSSLLMHKSIFTYFIASMIGLIPNCASSVIITELYLSNFISVGTMLSGLLTGSGLGILFLFKQNKNLKENMLILLLVYGIGVLVGLMVDLII